MTLNSGQDIRKLKLRCVYCNRIINYANQLAYDLSNPERKGHNVCGIREKLRNNKDFQQALSEAFTGIEASDER